MDSMLTVLKVGGSKFELGEYVTKPKRSVLLPLRAGSERPSELRGPLDGTSAVQHRERTGARARTRRSSHVVANRWQQRAVYDSGIM